MGTSATALELGNGFVHVFSEEADVECRINVDSDIGWAVTVLQDNRLSHMRVFVVVTV